MRDPRFIAAHRGGLLDRASHALLARWAADCAERVLPLFSRESDDARPRQALEVARAWADGEVKTGVAMRASVAAHAAAREVQDRAAIAAARAAAQAVATAHFADHSLGAFFYAMKAEAASGQSASLGFAARMAELPPSLREPVSEGMRLRGSRMRRENLAICAEVERFFMNEERKEPCDARPRGLVLILLRDEKGRFLLQHRDDTAPTYAGYWGFFGGGMEGAETPLEAIRREAFEELRYVPLSTAPVLTLAYSDERTGGTGQKFYFSERCADPRALEQHEGQGMGWFTLAEARALKITERNLATIAEILRLGGGAGMNVPAAYEATTLQTYEAWERCPGIGEDQAPPFPAAELAITSGNFLPPSPAEIGGLHDELVDLLAGDPRADVTPRASLHFTFLALSAHVYGEAADLPAWGALDAAFGTHGRGHGFTVEGLRLVPLRNAVLLAGIPDEATFTRRQRFAEALLSSPWRKHLEARYPGWPIPPHFWHTTLVRYHADCVPAAVRDCVRRREGVRFGAVSLPIRLVAANYNWTRFTELDG